MTDWSDHLYAHFRHTMCIQSCIPTTEKETMTTYTYTDPTVLRELRELHRLAALYTIIADDDWFREMEFNLLDRMNRECGRRLFHACRLVSAVRRNAPPEAFRFDGDGVVWGRPESMLGRPGLCVPMWCCPIGWAAYYPAKRWARLAPWQRAAVVSAAEEAEL